MFWIEIVICLFVTLALLPFTAFLLAKKDIFFTRLETGDIKFIDSGSSLHKIIYDTPGFELDENKKFVPSTTKRSHPWFGLYWIGIPPFRKIHKFTITKERENPSGKGVEDWIIKGKEEEVSSLRFTFPRPYGFPKVELGDENPVAVDLLAVSKFRVVDPVKPVYGLKGKFFENAGGIVRAGVADTANNYTFDGFIKEDKGETGQMFASLRDPAGAFNKALIEQVGLCQDGIAVSYDPANQALRDAMEAKTIAFANGEAIKVTADAKAYETEKAGTAAANVRKAMIKATVDGFGGFIPAAQEVLAKEAQPNVTTTVVGGATPAVVVGGEKK